MLATNCFNCHGPKKQQGGLRLDSREAALKGGDNGPVIDLKSPEKSLLLQALGYQGDLKMPPKGALAGDDVKALTEWIKQGIPWPKVVASVPPVTDPIALAKKTHWSFKPVVEPAVPSVHNVAWVQTPIDRFVLAKLESAGMQPSAGADR